MNRVCEILGITKSVIQAPMAWITSSDLAAAVSDAGGLGVLGTSADFTEIVKGDPDAGVNTVANVTSLIKSIDSCEDIVNELARPFEEG